MNKYLERLEMLRRLIAVGAPGVIIAHQWAMAMDLAPQGDKGNLYLLGQELALRYGDGFVQALERRAREQSLRTAGLCAALEGETFCALPVDEPRGHFCPRHWAEVDRRDEEQDRWELENPVEAAEIELHAHATIPNPDIAKA